MSDVSTVLAATVAHPTKAVVSVVIPTLASVNRRAELLRAIGSVFLAARSVEVLAIVCVNGERFDPEILAQVSALKRVRVYQLEVGSLPRAIALGRSKVESPFFCFLDDDDELLPNSIDLRLHALQMNPAIDVAVANGIRRTAQGDAVMLCNLKQAVHDPLRALLEENWLPSCGGLFRTERVPTAVFENFHDFAEWTWTAYQLAMNGIRLVACDEPSFVVNDTIGSRSKSAAYRASYLALFRRMLALAPPLDVKRKIQLRVSAALHDASVESLDQGSIGQAVRLHLQCLRETGGLRYLSYSRHLIEACLRRQRKPDAPPRP